jgi:predicted metal-binding protein
MMLRDSHEGSMKRLLVAAKKYGADEAKIVAASDIVVDMRVRLKCMVPICEGYGRHMMCPPSAMSVDDFSRVLGSYKRGILVQVVQGSRLVDKTQESERKLHCVVNRLEALAFKEGYYLAAGLICSSCTLCKKCVEPASGEPCRHPFEARPSMQSMGIDVVATCRKVGLPIVFSSPNKVRWTGLVLID